MIHSSKNCYLLIAIRPLNILEKIYREKKKENVKMFKNSGFNKEKTIQIDKQSQNTILCGQEKSMQSQQIDYVNLWDLDIPNCYNIKSLAINTLKDTGLSEDDYKVNFKVFINQWINFQINEDKISNKPFVNEKRSFNFFHIKDISILFSEHIDLPSNEITAYIGKLLFLHKSRIKGIYDKETRMNLAKYGAYPVYLVKNTLKILHNDEKSRTIIEFKTDLRTKLNNMLTVRQIREVIDYLKKDKQFNKKYLVKQNKISPNTHTTSQIKDFVFLWGLQIPDYNTDSTLLKAIISQGLTELDYQKNFRFFLNNWISLTIKGIAPISYAHLSTLTEFFSNKTNLPENQVGIYIKMAGFHSNKQSKGLSIYDKETGMNLQQKGILKIQEVKIALEKIRNFRKRRTIEQFREELHGLLSKRFNRREITTITNYIIKTNINFEKIYGISSSHSHKKKEKIEKYDTPKVSFIITKQESMLKQTNKLKNSIEITNKKYGRKIQISDKIDYKRIQQDIFDIRRYTTRELKTIIALYKTDNLSKKDLSLITKTPIEAIKTGSIPVDTKYENMLVDHPSAYSAIYTLKTDLKSKFQKILEVTNTYLEELQILLYPTRNQSAELVIYLLLARLLVNQSKKPYILTSTLERILNRTRVDMKNKLQIIEQKGLVKLQRQIDGESKGKRFWDRIYPFIEEKIAPRDVSTYYPSRQYNYVKHWNLKIPNNLGEKHSLIKKLIGENLTNREFQKNYQEFINLWIKFQLAGVLIEQELIDNREHLKKISFKNWNKIFSYYSNLTEQEIKYYLATIGVSQGKNNKFKIKIIDKSSGIDIVEDPFESIMINIQVKETLNELKSDNKIRTLEEFSNQFIKNTTNKLTNSSLNLILSHLKSDPKFEDVYLNKSCIDRTGLFNQLDYKKIIYNLQNDDLNPFSIHLLGQEIIMTLVKKIESLNDLKIKNYNLYLKKSKNWGSTNFLKEIKQSSSFKEYTSILKKFNLSIDFTPLLPKKSKFRFFEINKRTNHLREVILKLSEKTLRSVIIKNYLEMVKSLSNEEKLKLGIIEIPSINLQDLEKLNSKKFIHSNTKNLDEIREILGNINIIVNLYVNWENRSPHDINFMEFLKSNRSKFANFSLEILDSINLQGIIQLIDAIFQGNFINKVNSFNIETLSIITNTIINHIVGCYIINYNTNLNPNFTNTIQNLTNLIKHKNQDDLTPELLTELTNIKETSNIKLKLISTIESKYSPISEHKYWHKQFKSSNHKSLVKREKMLGIENPIFIVNQSPNLIKGLPDKSFNGLFFNGNYAIEYKIPFSKKYLNRNLIF